MPEYLEFEVELLEIQPRIWRRFQLASVSSFETLHDAIQDAFGWERKHLYEFRHFEESEPGVKPRIRRIARCRQAEILDDEVVPFADDLLLGSFFAEKEYRCLYLYDFGDNWQHFVELKETLELPEKFTRRLLNGARACPPEDCGGTMGYEECCEAVSLSKSDIRKLDAYAREEVESRLE